MVEIKELIKELEKKEKRKKIIKTNIKKLKIDVKDLNLEDIFKLEKSFNVEIILYSGSKEPIVIYDYEKQHQEQISLGYLLSLKEL
ncbi:MAG: hypothetical protein Q8N08_05735 [Methanobacteriaceae archaeon]|nr:hypothetical protein [Methanobacteriaceae archaeon]